MQVDAVRIHIIVIYGYPDSKKFRATIGATAKCHFIEWRFAGGPADGCPVLDVNCVKGSFQKIRI